MMKRLLGATVALTLALSASVALAGTYVTGALPSEFGGGFIPPDPAILKNVQKAAKEGAKLAASVEKCYSKGAANYSKNKATGVHGLLERPLEGRAHQVRRQDPGHQPEGAGPSSVPQLRG